MKSKFLLELAMGNLPQYVQVSKAISCRGRKPIFTKVMDDHYSIFTKMICDCACNTLVNSLKSSTKHFDKPYNNIYVHVCW